MQAAERAAEESEDKHMAVTLIACIYRGRKARSYIIQKRSQLLLEKTIETQQSAVKAVSILQYNWRGYSTRRELQSHGFKLPSNKAVVGLKKKKKKKRLVKTNRSASETVALKIECTRRAHYEQQQRRITDRNQLFHDIFMQYLQTLQFLRATTNTWIANDWKRLKRIKEFEAEREIETKIHFDLQKQAGIQESALTPSEKKTVSSYLELQIKVKQSFEKMKTIDARSAICKNIGDWIVMVVRAHLRRKSIIEARFDDLAKRLHWLGVESVAVGRILHQLDARKVSRVIISCIVPSFTLFLPVLISIYFLIGRYSAQEILWKHRSLDGTAYTVRS